MPPESRPEPDPQQVPDADTVPAISTCETRPGQVVFLESRNTDGWIATDLVVDTSP